MTSQIKTLFLLALLSGLMVVIGGALGGRMGVVVALGLALVMNVGSYWYSDKIVLNMYKAQERSPQDAPVLHTIVEELAYNAGIPKPRVCVIPEDAPNAFATGRDPEHGVVAVTEGIVHLLSTEELRGVLAHEIGHIKNRDILIQTVASVLGSAIVSIAHILQFSALFGGSRDENNGSGWGALLMALLAPIAAGIIQMAISRSREYLADDTGATLSGMPLSLASALRKLSEWNQQVPMHNGNATTAQMFIVAPLFGGGMASLFSTHPPIEERVARLEAMARQR